MVRISYMPKASAAAEDFRRIFKINGISTRMIQEDGSETGKIILSDGEKKEEILPEEFQMEKMWDMKLSEKERLAYYERFYRVCMKFMEKEPAESVPAGGIEVQYLYCAKIDVGQFNRARAAQKALLKKTEKTAPPQVKSRKNDGQERYFGNKRLRRMCKNGIPSDILEIPSDCDVIVSDLFSYLPQHQLPVRIQKIVIPETVLEIQENAFKNVIVGESISVPESVSVIGDHAFRLGPDGYILCPDTAFASLYCKRKHLRCKTTSIQHFTYEDAKQILKFNDDFENVRDMEHDRFVIPDGYEVIDSEVFPINFPNISIGTVIIPNTVKEIRDKALINIWINDTIYIPESVEFIGARPFKLSKNAYVTCVKDSEAYRYCHEHWIPNSADRSMGRCQYCGGEFEGILVKRCKKCGTKKDY